MNIKKRLTVAQLIALSFLAIIITGTLLLCLPVATKERVATPFIDSLFTATSATCVTGLVIEDTFSYWSTFGQIVILILIQIGGLGFMTFVTFYLVFIKKRISLYDRKVFMQSSGLMDHGSVIKLFKRIIFGTLIFEGIGTLLLCIEFVPEHNLMGVYYAVFHAISAFCNAGFDLFGNSMVGYSGSPLVIITVSLLIVIGGLGFIVWSDIIDCKLRFKKFRLHTKIVLVTTITLIVVPTLLFLAFDWHSSLSGMNFGEKLLASLFQVISPRTAGFYSIDLTKISDSSYILTILLMFIGGSSGSTAGGIKTTTFAVIIFSVFAEAKKKEQIYVGKRKLPAEIAKTASAILAMYVLSVIVASSAICAIDSQFNVQQVFYETVSAICTVGLSLGITPELSAASKAIITFLMFFGRIGSISFALTLGEGKENPPMDFPTEKIVIG